MTERRSQVASRADVAPAAAAEPHQLSSFVRSDDANRAATVARAGERIDALKAAEPATGEDLAIYQSIADNYNSDRERAASLVASEDMLDSIEVARLWEAFLASDEGQRGIGWLGGPSPNAHGAMFVAFRAGLNVTRASAGEAQS